MMMDPVLDLKRWYTIMNTAVFLIPPESISYFYVERVCTWCYSGNLLECYPGRTRRIFSGGTGLYPWQEIMFSLESHHWIGKSVMESP